ncbi:MAG: RHS repeat protein, partial [Propionibacteriaceae bacterium]|nr:RHS repeat protein [Propionibacteriaceae bacterium]
VRITRDGLGRVRTQTDPTGATTAFGWTTTGRPASRTNPDGTSETWAWDGEDNLVAHTDASGRETRYGYGPFDVLTEQHSPDGSRLAFAWDAERRLAAVTNQNGQTWRYERDLAGRVVAETDYDGRRTSHTLDAAGRVVATTNPEGQTVRLDLDALGRIVARHADGSTHYTWDAAGNLVAAATPQVSLERSYDRAGGLLAETVDGASLAWQLDAAGRVLARTTPGGADSIWTLDESGQRVGLALAGHDLAFALDPLGRTLETAFAGGTIESRYDPAGRLTGRTTTASGQQQPGWALDYGYAPTGELLLARDSRHGTREYTLDPAGRISRITAGGTETEEYAYDPAGNITSAAWQASTDDTAAQGEREYRGTLLVRAGRDHYDHDAAGRLIRRRRRLLSGGMKEWRYTWNALNQLTEVVTPEGHRWSYDYDPLGRRVAKTHHDPDGAVVESYRFTWDGSVLAEQVHSTPATITTTTWEHEGFTPIAQTRSSRPHPDRGEVDEWSQERVDAEFAAIVTDLVGTPISLLDTDGHTTWANQPNAWGASTADQAMPLRFPGQYHDAETGLHYNLNRYYNPDTGRYTTQDPLGLAPSPNPAAYVPNPTTQIDPLGLAGCSAATNGARASDFIASADGVVVPTSRARLVEGFERAGLPSTPTRAPGTQYTLPDGSLVRVMEPSGQATAMPSIRSRASNRNPHRA